MSIGGKALAEVYNNEFAFVSKGKRAFTLGVVSAPFPPDLGKSSPTGRNARNH